jgi:hypothetical protein
MAPKLGINVLWESEYYPSEGASSDSAIAFSDWMKIVAYYTQEAPDRLRMPDPMAALQTDLPLFDVRMPQRERRRR